jgi:hypothetical protein
MASSMQKSQAANCPEINQNLATLINALEFSEEKDQPSTTSRDSCED